MKTKLVTKNSDRLIIFLTGWGCDDVQFRQMTGTSDVLICWDYSDLGFEFDFSNYKTVDLIAYSAGVFVGGLIEEKLPNLRYKIAINGNPKMFDGYFGIPKAVLKVMRNLNLDNFMDFRREYLVTSEKELEEFCKNSSIRTFESCKDELDSLEKYSITDYKTMYFDVAILSECDKIFIPKHQTEYFDGKYLLLEGFGHNVFSLFTDYDEIINFALKKLS